MGRDKKNKDKEKSSVKKGGRKDKPPNNKKEDKNERSDGFAELLEYTRKRTLIR